MNLKLFTDYEANPLDVLFIWIILAFLTSVLIPHDFFVELAIGGMVVFYLLVLLGIYFFIYNPLFGHTKCQETPDYLKENMSFDYDIHIVNDLEGCTMNCDIGNNVFVPDATIIDVENGFSTVSQAISVLKHEEGHLKNKLTLDICYSNIFITLLGLFSIITYSTFSSNLLIGISICLYYIVFSILWNIHGQFSEFIAELNAIEETSLKETYDQYRFRESEDYNYKDKIMVLFRDYPTINQRKMWLDVAKKMKNKEFINTEE